MLFILIVGCKSAKIKESNIESSMHIASIQETMRSKNITNYFIVQHFQYGLITTVKKGYSKNNVCSPRSNVYYSLYVFWNEDNLSYVQKFDNCGKFELISIPRSATHEYYQNYSQDIIDSEVKQYKVDEKSYTTLNHQPLRYFWFIKNGETFKTKLNKFDLTTFGNESTWITKPNLNYEFNQNQPIVKLNEKSEELIDLLKKQKKFLRE